MRWISRPTLALTAMAGLALMSAVAVAQFRPGDTAVRGKAASEKFLTGH
jgi:hypothetical protein